VDWKAESLTIGRNKDRKTGAIRFMDYQGKLPRVNDGALLFLLYMISKRQEYRPDPDPQRRKRGSRIAIVFNGSPLFTGGAGSGESEIRRWIIGNDWLEAIVALPEQMFYNTGIGTFVWVVTNRKEAKRKGRIQLIDCRDRWVPMKRSLGDKRRLLDERIIGAVSHEHGNCVRSATSKIFDNADFGYRRITVERPLRLRFQITDEAKARFLNTYPELLDAITAVEQQMGDEPRLDWNSAWREADEIVKYSGRGWSAGAVGTAQKKGFRDTFSTVDPEAEPVVAKRGRLGGAVGAADCPGQTLPELPPAELDRVFGVFAPDGPKGKAVVYEPDPALRDNENIPLKEDIVSFFLREVRPYVADAWINPDAKLRDEQDGGIGKVGYEINFNREFFTYQPPRPLAEIDAELAAVEARILEMLKGVTE
jgi:type I restriction enzyme M protein